MRPGRSRCRHDEENPAWPARWCACECQCRCRCRSVDGGGERQPPTRNTGSGWGFVVTRLVTVLVTLAVPEEADAEDAAALVADAAVSTALEVVSATGVDGHLPVPGSLVQHTCGGREPWRVETVTADGATMSDLAGAWARMPLAILRPDSIEISTSDTDQRD